MPGHGCSERRRMNFSGSYLSHRQPRQRPITATDPQRKFIRSDGAHGQQPEVSITFWMLGCTDPGAG